MDLRPPTFFGGPSPTFATVEETVPEPVPDVVERGLELRHAAASSMPPPPSLTDLQTRDPSSASVQAPPTLLDMQLSEQPEWSHPAPPPAAGEEEPSPKASTGDLLSKLPSVLADFEPCLAEVYQSSSSIQQSRPPCAVRPSIAQDMGNAPASYLRPTVGIWPATEAVATTFGLPISLVATPLCSRRFDEEELPPVIPHQPSRCQRCRAYISPFLEFTDQGRTYICPICRAQNPVSDDFYGVVDPSNQRVDAATRPELSKGVVDYILPDAMLQQQEGFVPIEPPMHVFVIDTSVHAWMCGATQASINAIKEVISRGQVTGFAQGGRIGLVTYDSVVRVYRLAPICVEMLTPLMPEPFLPAPANQCCLPFGEAAERVLSCLSELERSLAERPIFPGDPSAQPAPLGLAIGTAQLLFEELHSPGRIELFYSTLPNIEPGKLVRRDDSAKTRTKDVALMTCANRWYTLLAKKLAPMAVGVDVYGFSVRSDDYIDLSTVGALARHSGGVVELFTNFTPDSGSANAVAVIRNSIEVPFVSDVQMRMRCAGALAVDRVYGEYAAGNGVLGGTDTITLPILRADASFSFELKHTGALPVSDAPAMKTLIPAQLGCLFSNENGQKVIRVMTFATVATALQIPLFKKADISAILTHYAKYLAFEAVHRSSRQDLRKLLAPMCIEPFSTYRKCSSTSDTRVSIILMPDTLPILPPMLASMYRHPMLRAANTVQPDQRSSAVSFFSRANPYFTLTQLYPRVIPLAPFCRGEFPEWQTGIQNSLPLSRAAIQFLDLSAPVLVDCPPNQLLLYVPDTAVLEEVAVSEAEEARPFGTVIPSDTDGGRALYFITAYLSFMRGGDLPIQYIPQSQAPVFSSLMVEDRDFYAIGYSDFLVAVHREILENTSSS